MHYMILAKIRAKVFNQPMRSGYRPSTYRVINVKEISTPSTARKTNNHKVSMFMQVLMVMSRHVFSRCFLEVGSIDIF